VSQFPQLLRGQLPARRPNQWTGHKNEIETHTKAQTK
jgi:hypothetical protein